VNASSHGCSMGNGVLSSINFGQCDSKLPSPMGHPSSKSIVNLDL
jgi:hypothetical protein